MELKEMSFQAQARNHKGGNMQSSSKTREGDQLKPSLGFIGMGHMGIHMAQRLLDAGYSLTVYDRTRQKAQEVGQRGAQMAQTPRDLAANCQVVMACVTDDHAQHDVMFGLDGALDGMHASSLMIVMSSVY